jgi:hypothetical protein
LDSFFGAGAEDAVPVGVSDDVWDDKDADRPKFVSACVRHRELNYSLDLLGAVVVGDSVSDGSIDL